MTESQDHGVDLETSEQRQLTPEEKRHYWEEHMRRWQGSGLTQAEYCRRHGLKWSTFHYWRKRIQRQSTEISLVQVPLGHSEHPGVGSCHDLILVLKDRYKVEVGDNFNPATLVRLVDTLQRFA